MGHTFQRNDYYTKPGDAYTERYYSYSHSGSFWFNVEKYYNSTVNDSFTAKAEYWYKTAVIDFRRSSFDYIIISESI